MKLVYLGNPTELTTKELIEIKKNPNMNSTSLTHINLELRKRKMKVLKEKKF
jgi:hypothetical protein